MKVKLLWRKRKEYQDPLARISEDARMIQQRVIKALAIPEEWLRSDG